MEIVDLLVNALDPILEAVAVADVLPAPVLKAIGYFSIFVAVAKFAASKIEEVKALPAVVYKLLGWADKLAVNTKPKLPPEKQP